MDDTVIVHPTQLAPRCARSSLKRARLLFNDSSSAVLPPSSDASPSNSIRDVISSYIPPMYDRDGSINRTNISRRVELAYNTDVDSLAFRNFDPTSGEGGTSIRSNSKKETATVRALREISDMASERIRSGLGPVVAEDEDGSNGGENEGRLVLHRDGNRPGGALVSTTTSSGSNNVRSSSAPLQPGTQRPVGGGILIPRDGSSSGGNINIPTPKWHAPWKLSTVISSHLGWVRSVAFDPTNVLFATGGADRVIKIFDLAKSCIAAEDALRITLTGHISPVRGLAFSERHPYLFSAGEDKLIKCWDLETNQVIRHYHGHLSGIFALKLHPTLDLLVTGGRDAVARVWDMRTKHQVHCLTGHDNTVGALLTKGTDPQVSITCVCLFSSGKLLGVVVLLIMMCICFEIKSLHSLSSYLSNVYIVYSIYRSSPDPTTRQLNYGTSQPVNV